MVKDDRYVFTKNRKINLKPVPGMSISRVIFAPILFLIPYYFLIPLKITLKNFKK